MGPKAEPLRRAGATPSSGAAAECRTTPSAGTGSDAVHDVRWEFAVPVVEPPVGRFPLRAYTVQGVRLEDQGGFPVSFFESFETLWPHNPRSWTADHTAAGKRPGSSNTWLPWLAVVDEAGYGSFLGIEWSGIWSTSVQWHPATDDRAGYVHMHAGSDFP